jgi:aminopeptidase
MRDPRLAKLAASLLDHSLEIKPGEKVLIEGDIASRDLAIELIAACYERKAVPFVQLSDARVRRAWYLGAGREQMDYSVKWATYRHEDIDASIGIYGGENDSEFADVPPEAMEAARLAFEPLVEKDLKKRWVVLRYPTPAGAQLAGMSTDAFEDFCLDVSTIDYSKMSAAMDPLKALMERTDRVRIVSPGTDLAFSIKGISVEKSAGNENVPDGEVFTSPVRDSVNGTILFNVPSLEEGTTYERVCFTLEDGRIVDADGTEREKLLKILGSDEGARYLGEFALGVNPRIRRPMRDTLYDEKIAGSLHFAAGRAYEEADNGNRSSVHWDLVLIQTPEWGGGEIWFDDVLVRKDGRFVLPQLQGLNPENLD